MRRARIPVGAAVVVLAVGGSCSDDDAGDPTAEARTEPPTTLAADASANDLNDAPTTSQARTEPSTPPAEAPAEVTACIEPGPEVHRGTEEEVVIPVADGDMTILQSRGFTYLQSLTSVSDPRLEGTYEGLTAIVGFVDFWIDCAVTGYIIDGSVPAPPTPQTGQ